MELPIYVFDSDGNPLDPGNCNMDEAIHIAAHYVLDVWPDYERASIGLQAQGQDSAHVVARVERVGPKGSRRVRITLDGAGWVFHEVEMSAAATDMGKER